jgi:hypothetical protein
VSYDPQYLGRNLNGRTQKALLDFQAEETRVTRTAAANGSLHGSRTFIALWEAGVAVLEREVKEAIQLAYNVTGEHTGEVYDQVAFCSKQMVERIMQSVRQRAGASDQQFGGSSYAEIVNRMLTAMNETRDRLLDDFKHGMTGTQKMKQDPVLNVVQSNSPGAVLQVGSGNFNQSAYNQSHQSLVQEIEKVLASPDFAALKVEDKVSVQDIADVVKEEAKKTEPDVGKLKRWGDRLVKISEDVGLKVVSGTIAGLLLKMYTGAP